jgi:hypothetical protein
MPRKIWSLTRDIPALIAFVESRHAIPHAWGRENNDCAGYALAAVEAETGVRVARALKWRDRASALRVIARFGSLEAAFDAHFERVAPALAKRGDIAGIPDEEFGIHPMIVEGTTLVGPGEQGNRRQPRAAMTLAWSAVTGRSRPKKAKPPIAGPSEPTGAGHV